jgi:hypothetical protein
MSTLHAQDIDADALQALLDAEGIELGLAADAAVTVRPGERQQSDMETVYAGGWIECPTAWALAQKLGIPVQKMGVLLEHLKVKVRNCGLGCF